MINQSINLNLIPGAIPPRIKVSQYDEGSRTLTFMLYNGSSQYAGESGITAKIQGTKPDGHGFCYDATYGQETGYCYITADLTRQMTVVAGAVTCEIVLEKNSQVLGTGNFILDVEAGALSDDTDISDTEIPAIIDAAETNAERAEDAADRAEAASAHAPYIGNNEHWYVWDSTNSQYVDSGVDAKGDDGATIVSITKTGTSGNVDTYTITMSDGTTSTFTVTNGTSALPGGGTKGQVLTKKSGTTGDADWSSDLEQGQTALLSSTVGWTGKNEFYISDAIPRTISRPGVSFSFTRDAVTANGTATENLSIDLSLAYYYGEDFVRGLLNKKWIFTTELPYDATTANISLYYKQTANSNIVYLHNGDELYLTDMPYSLVFSWYVPNGAQINSSVCRPMIRDARISDATYEPHHDSVEACKYNRSEANVLGAKNLLENTASGKEENGLTFVINSDKSVSVYGTATARTLLKIATVNTSTIPQGNYLLSGCKGGTSNTYKFLYTDNQSQSYSNYDGDTAIVIFTRETSSLYIEVANGANLGTQGSPTIFRPMIRLATDPDSTYAPYAMTNRELTTGKLNSTPIILSSANDLNNVFDTGLYYFTSAPSHSPESASYAPMLVVTRTTGDTQQLIFGVSAFYSRHYGGSPASWSNWVKYSGTVVS